MILFAYTDIRVLKLLCSCPGVEVCIEHQIDLYSNICTTPISKSTVLIFKLNVHIFKSIVYIDLIRLYQSFYFIFKIGKIDLRIGLNAMVELF